MNCVRWGTWTALVGLCLYGVFSCCYATDPDSPDMIIEDPSFSQDIQPVFNTSCILSGCHNAAASAGLDLREGRAYADLVNIASTQTSALRVSPFAAQDSYLVIKLEGNQSSGSRMPLGAPPLNPSQIQNIRNWISRGARNN